MLKKAFPNDISKRIYREKPILYSYHNALFVPQSPVGIDKKSGLYDCYGNLINQAAIFSGTENNLHIHVQEYKTKLNFQDNYPEFESFFWGGYFSDHYGHFLIETLPRLIRYSFIKDEKNLKIIFLSKKSKEEMIETKWVRFIFERLNINLDDIFIPLFPIKIKEIIFCSDYISEQNYANLDSHRIFKIFSKKEFKNIHHTQKEKKFAYISRSKLSSGTHKITNETELENIISKFGVSIFFPEELSIIEQVYIIENYKCVGFLGSFFHNCLFSTNTPEFLCLSYGENLNINYSLLDFISNSNSDYYVPELNVIGNSESFYEICVIKDVNYIAEFIMRWFNSEIDRNPSYLFKYNNDIPLDTSGMYAQKITDRWNRDAKLSPHTGKIIFVNSETSNKSLIDVIIISRSKNENYLIANSSYNPLIKIGPNGNLQKIIPVIIEKKQGFSNIKDNEGFFLTSIPKDGYSVSDVRLSNPDEWEQFFLTDYAASILIS